MEVKVKKLQGCKRTLSVELPGERAAGVYRKLLADFKRDLQLPGFRKGKVPDSLIRQRFSEELRHEVIDTLVPKALEEAIKAEKLRPVERPTLDDVAYEEGQPLRISASFEVQPDIQLERYTGFEIELDGGRYEVTGEQINEQIEILRRRAAAYKPLEEEREAREGDFALVNLRGEPQTEDSAPFRREGVLVAVGKGDPLGDRLVGARPGRRLEVAVSYPEDFDDPAMAGRAIEYTVDLLELKQRELPEPDDEFARDLGHFSDLEELRGEIRRQLEDEAGSRRRDDQADALLEKILESNPPFELPSVMSQRQIALAESEMRAGMVQRGLNPNHIGFDWSAFRESQRPAADKAVRRALLLDEVAAGEGISVEPKDVKAEVAAMAAARGQDAAELRRQMLADGSYEALRDHLQQRAVQDWLIEHNKTVWS